MGEIEILLASVFFLTEGGKRMKGKVFNRYFRTGSPFKRDKCAKCSLLCCFEFQNVTLDAIMAVAINPPSYPSFDSCTPFSLDANRSQWGQILKVNTINLRSRTQIDVFIRGPEHVCRKRGLTYNITHLWRRILGDFMGELLLFSTSYVVTSQRDFLPSFPFSFSVKPDHGLRFHAQKKKSERTHRKMQIITTFWKNKKIFLRLDIKILWQPLL